MWNKAGVQISVLGSYPKEDTHQTVRYMCLKLTRKMWAEDIDKEVTRYSYKMKPKEQMKLLKGNVQLKTDEERTDGFFTTPILKKSIEKITM